MKNTIKTELIYSFIKENNLTKSDFCKLCEISEKSLEKILVNNFDFPAIDLFKVAKLLKVEAYKLFN